MKENPRIKVVNPDNGWLGTKYYINEQEIGNVCAVDFRGAVDEVPTFTFETRGLPDIDMSGNVRFDFTPKTVREAVVILRNELLKHGDLYNGFLASISSTLKEIPEGMGMYDVAEKIITLLIGED